MPIIQVAGWWEPSFCGQGPSLAFFFKYVITGLPLWCSPLCFHLEHRHRLIQVSATLLPGMYPANLPGKADVVEPLPPNVGDPDESPGS